MEQLALRWREDKGLRICSPMFCVRIDHILYLDAGCIDAQLLCLLVNGKRIGRVDALASSIAIHVLTTLADVSGRLVPVPTNICLHRG